MPPSIQFVQDVRANGDFANAISTAPNLAELLDLVPAPYRSSMQDLVYRVYRAALKSNNTRSYLAGLEKHEQDGDFPPEIGARIAAPALQISKEFMATAEYRSIQAEFDKNTLETKKGALKAAIALKKKELLHLQTLFAESTYKDEADNVLHNVVKHLVEDAGMVVRGPDGSSAESSWPSWIKADHDRMKQHRMAFPARAVALAFTQVSQEMSRKMRGLSLKKKTDGDIEMGDDASPTDNVAIIVQRELAKLLKENKLQNVGNNGKGKKRQTSSSKSPARQGNLPFKVGKSQGSRPSSQGGKGKGKKSNKK